MPKYPWFSKWIFLFSLSLPFQPHLKAIAQSPLPEGQSRVIRQQTSLSLDVNKDGEISPADALSIINYLNKYGAKAATTDTEHLDVDKSGRIVPLDVLVVTNYLNAAYPLKPLEFLLAAPEITAATEIVLGWAALDSTQSLIAYRFRLKKPDGSFTDWVKQSQNLLTLNTEITAEGEYSFELKAQYPDTYWSGTFTYTFLIDRTAPSGTVKINNDSQYTNSTQVILTLSAADSASGMGTASQMQFSHDGISWSIPEAYATTRSWSLSAGDGQKKVYVKFKDAAGNWSAAFTDTITLDTTQPTISINPITSPTKQNVTLSYAVTDNFSLSSEIVVSGDNSPYLSEGRHNITLTARDLAENTSSASLSFTIDKTPPVMVITSPPNGAVLADSQVQLDGTVDGVAFSETRTLTQSGENTITKTAIDTAGNTASLSVTVYFYPGQLIGPAGGEVYSLDRRVHLIIPSGALSAPQEITILSPIEQYLVNVVPQGQTLLAAADFKPSNFTFNQPVTVIYTLPQAEVPGTEVELGLYNSQTDKITPTGKISQVSTDGYTVSFSIEHFSTYAALKGLFSQGGAPIGSGVDIPLPDMFTGAFSHSLSLTLPPGRKGMQPNLSLNYRSSNPNSWLGVGFSLNPGYIVRSTRLGPPSYNDAQDSFYFINDSGSTELVHLTDNLYQAKIESSFTKFFKLSDDSWKVVEKNGMALYFGQTSSSKETSPQGTFAWYLTQAKDTNNNFIAYNYTKDQGKPYLDYIDYTGNENISISAPNRIEFNLADRSDISSSFISGQEISTSKRLSEIAVKQNGQLVWRYELEYTLSPDTERSLLTSITQYGADGAALPTQKFRYQSN